MAGSAASHPPAPFYKSIDTLDRGILLAESSLALVIVVAMVLAAVAEATANALKIHHPILGQVSEVLMHGTIWAAFLGASFATRTRRHLAIDAIGRLLPAKARHLVSAVALTLGSIVAAALANGIWTSLHEQALQAAEQIAQYTQLNIQDAVVDRSFEFQYVIPIGFTLIAIRLLLHGFHEFVAVFRQGQIALDAQKIEAIDPMSAAYEADRMAPVDRAYKSEIIVAIAALVAIPIFALKTIVFLPLLVAAIVAALFLLIPLLKRKDQEIPVHPEKTISFEGSSGIAAVVSTGVVLGAAYFAIANLASIPVGWGIAFFAVMAFMGAPLFTFLGGLALFLWLHGTSEVPPMSLPNSVEDVLGPHFARMSVLPTIPVFTLAGYLLSESKAPERLVRVARAFLGFMPGGLAVVCILASAFFTVFSGASGITIVAVGGLLLPALLKDGYPEKFSLGLVTTGGALGVTFPLCLPLIVYGIVAGLQEVPPGVEKLSLSKFMFAGLLPGLLLIGLLMIYAMIVGAKSKVPRSKFDWREAIDALSAAKWELFLPVVPVVGLLTGIFTPTGAAAFTAFYVLIIEVFAYKDLSITKDIPRIIPESMVLVGAIFVKLCAATVLTFYFVQAQTADKLFETLTCGAPAQAYLAAHSDTLGTCREAVDALSRAGQSAGGLIDSPITFLLALNVFLLIVGMLMDIFSAIVVIVPLIMGIAIHFHINPYHLGVIFLLNLEIGYLMPPMGLNLFIAGFRFGKPVPALYGVVIPFILIFAVALGITTYVPALTLALVPGSTEQVHAQEPTEVVPETTPTTPTAPVAPAGNCDEPLEGEAFDAFEARCMGAGAAAGGAAAPAAQTDCDEPREGEAFDAFEARCLSAPAPTEAAPAEAPADDADCEQPRDGEAFDAFATRCHIS